MTPDEEPRTVHDVRVEKGMTLQELAERTGIPVRILSMIDKRHYRASPEQVERLCEALGVRPEELDIGLPKTVPGMWGSGGTYS